MSFEGFLPVRPQGFYRWETDSRPYKRIRKKVPQMRNMRISSMHTSRRQRIVFQQNPELNIAPWETLAVREKRAHVKTASKSYRKNPTNTNARKLKTAQYELAGIYINEQTEYIKNQIDKIRDSVDDRQSRIAWQTINEVSRRKSTVKAKLKAANQQERIKLWKQHFENLQGNPPKVTHEPITRIISKQLDIKLGPFTQEELDTVHIKIKNRKAAGLDEIPPEVWKTRQFDRWMKGCILPLPKKSVLGLELPWHNTYIHSSKNLQCSTTKPHRTQNRQHP